MLALAGLGAGSLLSFMAACGSVNEPFVIVVGGVDAGADDGATTDASSDDAATDATVQDSGPDGSVQDASVDATVTDAGADAAADAAADARQDSAIVDAGPVLADGSSVVTVGDAQVIIPPLDPTLLGDGGISLSDGGLVAADGGTLTPRAFRDLVNGITCQRAQECCCPGCSAVDLATPGAGFSQSKCTTGLGSNGIQRVLFGNETIPAGNLATNTFAMAQCVALLNDAVSTCQSLTSSKVSVLRSVCLQSFNSTRPIGEPCNLAFDCQMPARCGSVDGGAKTCQPLVSEGSTCAAGSDCTPRGIQGTPPLFCNPGDAGPTCTGYLAPGEACPFESACGSGTCIIAADQVKRCSASLPFAALGDPASYCTAYTP